MIKTAGLDHVALTVTDLERSVQWYKDLFGMQERFTDVWGPVPRFLMLGWTGLALFPTKAGAEGPPGWEHLAVNHIAFRTTRAEFLRAQDELKQRGIAYTFSDHQVCHSIYFCDPDGHRLELTTYELA